MYMSDYWRHKDILLDTTMHIHDIDKYEHIIKIANDANIDILPYLYTLSILNDRELHSFTKFFIMYLRKIDNTIKDNDSLIKILSESLDNIILFIITIQYYFL